MLDIPISALFVCYGPLLVTVLGFIAFAVLTDVNARRTYLRRIDPRPESERPEVHQPVVTRRTTAQTPAGARVTIIPSTDTALTVTEEAPALGPTGTPTLTPQTATGVDVPVVPPVETDDDNTSS